MNCVQFRVPKIREHPYYRHPKGQKKQNAEGNDGQRMGQLVVYYRQFYDNEAVPVKGLLVVVFIDDCIKKIPAKEI